MSRPGRRILLAGRLTASASPGRFAAHLTVTLAMSVLPVATAWLMKSVVDSLVARDGAQALLGLGTGLAAAGVAASILPQLDQYLQSELERRVALRTQDTLFASVDGFVGLRRFEDPHFLDRLRLAQPAGGMNPQHVVDGTLGAVRAGLTMTGFLGSLLLLSPVMAALVLLSGIPVLLAQLSLSRRRARVLWEVGPAERREFVYGDLMADATAAKEIRLFGIGGFLRRRMLHERGIANEARRAVDRRAVTVQTRLALLSALVSGTGLLWAVHAARSGSLSVGGITVFVAAVAGVQSALTTVAAEAARAHQALLLFDHYLAVTSAGPDLPVAADARPAGPLNAGITLRDVWFRYSDDHPWVLRGVDLHIPHGKATALVGLNGAGKSTLVKLLCRLYDPTRGTILWDGADLRDLNVAELRHRIGAVFQDYMEYDMTAAENVAMGDLDALGSPERIRAAARRAGVDDRIATLPRGYDTLLTRLFFSQSDKDDPQTGVVLSGGQWQRIALARAFLRDGRDLMILDEPSAGLDAEAEHEIHTSLRRHREGRTSLLISHRLSAVRDADLIVVLADGRIAEQGDHAHLMAAGGAYARLFRLQASGYEAEAAPGAVAEPATLPARR